MSCAVPTKLADYIATGRQGRCFDPDPADASVRPHDAEFLVEVPGVHGILEFRKDQFSIAG